MSLIKLFPGCEYFYVPEVIYSSWLGILLRQRIFPGLGTEMPRSPEVPEAVFVHLYGVQESIPGELIPQPM
jgi:hypothetical protein